MPLRAVAIGIAAGLAFTWFLALLPPTVGLVVLLIALAAFMAWALRELQEVRKAQNQAMHVLRELERKAEQ